MLLRARPLLALATTLCLVVAWASPATATEATFKRAMSNLLFGPFDIVLSPIVGPRSVYQNLQDIDDSTGVRIAYTVPGVVWNTFFNVGGGMLRVFTGALEIVPGVLLLPFETDMNPLFAPPERAEALIEEETHLGTVKIGINYMN
ncbi:MAG: hypothetical protein JRH16_18985 [Deltaproteobacteria bacterium]|nr:hypothetical protein [Deltaproteobacteria bacterium]MBW2362208.1 hypothetical protein [Deltaproteobacteria bacterium]